VLSCNDLLISKRRLEASNSNARKVNDVLPVGCGSAGVWDSVERGLQIRKLTSTRRRGSD